MKKLILLMSVATVMLMLAGCACKHEWVDATCSEAKHCSKCGQTEGFPLQHQWKEATCTEPKTCELCGVTEGNPKEHVWKERTMTEPKTCTECGATEGEKITCTEVCVPDIIEMHLGSINKLNCFEDTMGVGFVDSDEIIFYDYEKKKVATVDIVPEGETYRYDYEFITPPLLGQDIALLTILYGPGKDTTICFYDQFGKELNRIAVDTGLPEGQRIYARNCAAERYVRFNKRGVTEGINAILVIDTVTMTVVDSGTGYEDVGKYSKDEYSACYVQPTIKDKYALVIGKDGSYRGYVDQYYNKVAIYKDASCFNYYGFALVSEDGKSYDLINDNLEVVGEGLLKGSNVFWIGGAVLGLEQNGKQHYYCIK